MKKLAMFIALFLCVGFHLAMAQTVRITGTVTSKEDGQPLPGVAVTVKGSNIGTATDFQGKYILSVPADAKILVAKFIGMKTQEVAIGGKSVVDIDIERGDVGLNEVVVVAYGTKTKRSITGAISTVDSKTLNNQIAVSPLRALQGSAPGVNVLTSGGQPGVDPTIRIRGIGSVNASADPLIVVDGVVYNGQISNISADQIESISTLKDAAATSLYGSRAANGVVLITTKTGKYNSPTMVTVTAKSGFSSPAVKSYKLVGATDYMKYTWEALKNTNWYVNGEDMATAAADATSSLVDHVGYNPFNVANPIDATGNVVKGAKLLWDTDWYNELIRKNASFNDYSIGIQGGSDKIVYSFSGNYLKQQGSVIESDFDRFASRLNVEAKVKKWLDAGFNLSYSRSKQNYPNQAGTAYESTMQWINSVASIYPVYQRDENGSFKKDSNGNYIYDYGNDATGQSVNGTRSVFNGENAVSTTKLNSVSYKRNNFFANVFTNIKFYNDLSLKSTLGYENYVYDSYEYDNVQYGAAASVNGRITQNRNVTESYTLTNDLKYNKTVGDHTFNADLISEIYDYKYNKFDAQATGYLPGVTVLSGSTTPELVEGYINEERIVSYLGRIDYAYQNRYNLSLSYRTDGSTRFSSNKRWGNFYSVGANWIISDESFLQGNDIVSMAKFRASYGELGNNKLDSYFPYLASYSTGWSNNKNIGVLKGGVVDENLTWEKTGLFNVGFDFGFLKDRISGTIEFYNKKSIDLIFDKPITPSTGSTTMTTNIGSMRNRGLEFSITTKNIVTSEFEWSTSFNISSNKNKILSLSQPEIIDGTKKYMVGRSFNEFFIPEYAGVDPLDGYAMWYIDQTDANGNVTKGTTKTYSQATKYYEGCSLPDYIGGFSSFVRFKNFDFNIMFNYSLGGKLYDYSYANLMSSLYSAGDQVSADISSRWQNMGDETSTPLLLATTNDFNSTSTRFLFKNNYLRMKSVSIGYNFPLSLIKKWSISDVRIYLQGDNLLTFQSHKGIDPEQNISGTTDNRSYLMKTITAGISVKF